MKRALLAAAFAFAVAACGGGSGSGGSDDEGGSASGIASENESDAVESGLPSELSADYADVERCTHLRGAEPSLVLEEPRACPVSGRMCCLPSVDNFECGLLNLSTCGASGLYDETTQTIHLPDGCMGAFRHEAVHHLLFVNGRADWRSHAASEFACQ